MTTQEVVTSYYQAWTSRNYEKARSLLADDLKFDGAIDHFQKADDLMRALQGFTQMLTGVNLIAQFFSGDQAMMLYDCVTPTPAGTVRTAEHFVVKDGRIREIKVVFDATELRKLMPQ